MRRFGYFLTPKAVANFERRLPSFYSYQSPLLPKTVTDNLMRLEVTLETQQKLQQSISSIRPSEINEQSSLTQEELKLIAIKLATEHIPDHVAKQMLVIGKKLYQNLINERPNSFVKSLFKKNASGYGGCPALFLSPNVTKVAFETLDSYPPQVMSKVVSDGISRVGEAILKLGTKQDVFNHPELVDPKPIMEFKNKYDISNAQNDHHLHPSLQLLSALRDSAQNRPLSKLAKDDPLLIQFKCFEILAGKELSYLDSKLIPKAVENKDIQNAIYCLLHELEEDLTKDIRSIDINIASK